MDEVVNLSQHGASPDRQIRVVIEWIAQNGKPDMVIMPVSHYNRFDLPIAEKFDPLHNLHWNASWQVDLSVRKNIDKKKYTDIHVILTGFRRSWTINKLKEMGIGYTYYEMVNNDTLNELYNIIDLYIISSRVEGGPQSIYEAALTKCPIISTHVGNADIILNNESIYDYTRIDNYFVLPKVDIHGNYNRAISYSIENYMARFNSLFLID